MIVSAIVVPLAVLNVVVVVITFHACISSANSTVASCNITVHWSELGLIVLCPGVIIQSYQQLVRRLSSRPADKGFRLPEPDGSDQFLRLALTARQSLKLKARTTFNKNSSFKAYDYFDLGLSAFILKREIWIHFVLNRGALVCVPVWCDKGSLVFWWTL